MSSLISIKMSDNNKNNKSDKIFCYDGSTPSDSNLMQQFLNSSTNNESEEPGRAMFIIE